MNGMGGHFIRRSFAAITMVGVLLCLVELHKKSIYHTSQNTQKHAPFKSIDIRQKAQCTIFLQDHKGRLGNRLFMFSTAVGLALTHSCHLHISAEIIQELKQWFVLDLETMPITVGLSNSVSRRKLFNHCSQLTVLVREKTRQTIEITGFWQVHIYFSNHSAEIQRQLRFRSTILQQVDAFLNKNNTSPPVTRVGIHIRRGDFLRKRVVSSNQYVLAAMSYFTRKYHSVIFVIVSDDRPYCKRVFGKRNDVLFTPLSFNGAMDLATLTRCDHAIITAGTFGWWGAYLLHNRTGEVMTDAKPDHSPIDAQCEGSLYFPSWYSFLNKTL